MTMEALVYTGTQEVEYRDENKPVPGPNQALIEVAATAFVALTCTLIMV